MAAPLTLGFLVVHALRYNIHFDDVVREVEREVGSKGIVVLGDGVDNSRMYSQRLDLCCAEEILSTWNAYAYSTILFLAKDDMKIVLRILLRKGKCWI